MSPRAGAVVLGALALAAAAPAAAAASDAGGAARLQGTFAVAGRITRAVEIPGERPGQRVTRRWAFTPQCASGACPSVLLRRGRGPGRPRNTVRLRRDRPGLYIGQGTFWAPLRCGSGTYRPGQRVHFQITVRITATTVSGGAPLATRLRASYASGPRENLTPCVALFGQGDAATYHGHLLSAG